MMDSDQIKKLKERNEQLQRQLEGSKKKVSDLQEKLKHGHSPPPLPKDGAGAARDPGELEKKIAEFTERLARQNQEFERSLGKLREELRAAREEKDEFAEQLRTLREKLVASASSPPAEKEEEPDYDPETQKYKLSWVGDSLKDVGKKGPPAAKKEERAGLDRRTTEEKIAAMASEKQALEKKKEKKKEGEEELEETASYSVGELMERAKEPGDLPTVPGVSLGEASQRKAEKPAPEGSDVAVVTSESGGRPVLRMHAVPDDEVAEPTLQEPEQSPAIGAGEEEVTDKRAEEEVRKAFHDDEAEIMTEEKAVSEVTAPRASEPVFSRLARVFSEHRSLILKSLLFLAGAGLGVGLALLIFLGPDTGESGEEAVEEPAEAPQEEKIEKTDTTDPGMPDKKGGAAAPKTEKAPAELVEPIYRDAAVMDKKEAGKVGAALKVLVGEYPRDPMLRYHYARALYHNGYVDAAIGQLEETMKLDPDMPEVHYMLGGIYLRMGDEKKAHEALDAFTRLTSKPNQ